MKILTAKEVAEMLKVSLPTLYKMAQEQEVPAFKVAGSWRFEKESIEAWIMQQLESSKNDKLQSSLKVNSQEENTPIRAGGARNKNYIKFVS